MIASKLETRSCGFHSYPKFTQIPRMTSLSIGQRLVYVSAAHGHGSEGHLVAENGQSGLSAKATCRSLQLYTHAGPKQVTCKVDCKHEGPGATIMHNSKKGDECLTVSPAGFDHMKCEVNYTCKLGLCDHALDCQPSNLLIGCWKPIPTNQYSHVISYKCPQ
uniref:Evasin n=1 Tax=Rhipicephalus microplus TaxID=6941 RepID=A0A6G5AF29_RHIMP